jgi:hypothetical protein
MAGSGELYNSLHEVFDGHYAPTSLHRFLAELPSALRSQGKPGAQVIVTTNYDDALEKAFDEMGETYDVLSYISEGPDRGRCWHQLSDGTGHVIERPNEYDQFDLGQRSVIAKIHGAFSRNDPDRDSYVITEDHYIDYLTRTDIGELLPIQLAERVRRSHFLFLGYSLSDWNLRVILHRIWGAQKLRFKSWAVQLKPLDVDRKSWSQRDVDLITASLEEYMARLRIALRQEVTS